MGTSLKASVGFLGAEMPRGCEASMRVLSGFQGFGFWMRVYKFRG